MSQAFDWQVGFAAALIRRGAVIAYPTESVWGLGCDPYNANAVRRLLRLKDRAESKGLILISGDEGHFCDLLSGLNADQLALFRKEPPRPTTWLIPDNNLLIPSWVKGEHASVAVRVSKHKAITALTKRLGHPIISTSANPSGSPTAISSLMLHRYFNVGWEQPLAYILPGRVRRGAQASTIKNIVSNQIIRG